MTDGDNVISADCCKAGLILPGAFCQCRYDKGIDYE